LTQESITGETPHLWIKDITEKDNVKGCYLVKEKRVGTTRRGEPFITLTLADRTGELVAKVWEGAERLSSLFRQGDIIEVDGYAGSYQGQLQITVSGLKNFNDGADPEIFLEVAPGDPSKMMASLKENLRGIKNVHLRALLDRFMGDRQFVSLFRKAPAAKSFHHCYLGGLLEHTLSVCRMATQIASHYPQLDRDLLLTAAFLHDIGKIRELVFDRQIDYTNEGRLIGHVVLGLAMVDEKLNELKDSQRT
jgi:3'-5' exoribonuclease